MSARRARVLELAVLGHLARAPMHGYELRKRLNAELGAFRAFSYGSLYPCLKDMLRNGLVSADSEEEATARGRRARIVYRLTEDGRHRLCRLLAESAPAAMDDECFGVHFTLFGRTRTEVRLRILTGRRARLLDRLGELRERLAQTSGAGDPYIFELTRHHAESIEREVGWIDDLIQRERHCAERVGSAEASIGGTDPPRQGTAPTDQQ